ncbi:MAG: CatB-related O-acetyltransferase [Clostridiales bacterium]|nr:CatB-related O-acetyltransferase [Clostridiales bacterium]
MMIPETKLYPRTGDAHTIYLQHAVTSPQIKVGAYTMYHEFAYDPRLFETNNVLYQYPINRDRLIIGKFCSIASGVRFLFNSANHALGSLSTYPFPLFFEQWNLPPSRVTQAWDNRGDIVVGNDVWIGYQAVVLSGVKIGDGAIIGARAVVTKDVPPYTIVGGVPAGPIRKRFDDDTIRRLQAVRWWDWEPERIRRHIGALTAGRISELEDEALHRI